LYRCARTPRSRSAARVSYLKAPLVPWLLSDQAMAGEVGGGGGGGGIDATVTHVSVLSESGLVAVGLHVSAASGDGDDGATMDATYAFHPSMKCWCVCTPASRCCDASASAETPCWVVACDVPCDACMLQGSRHRLAVSVVVVLVILCCGTRSLVSCRRTLPAPHACLRCCV
jgi:hypothetical protein